MRPKVKLKIANKKFKKGQEYNHRDYMELSIREMCLSKSEHAGRVDSKVGAVLVATDGSYIEKAHRGELRNGDHAEFTLLDKKLSNMDLSGDTLYTTLEPCVERNPPKSGCSFRTINARISNVYVGHLDPDPSVQLAGVRVLKNKGIKVDYYDKDLNQIIAQENEQFFAEARQRAKDEKKKEISAALDPFENELSRFQLTDFSEEAQREMIDKMNLKYKFGSDAYHSFLYKLSLINVNPKTKAARPTGLGLLLLGKEPQIHFPQARLKFTIRRQNHDPIIKDFAGPLVLLPTKIEEYLEVVFPKEVLRSRFQRDEKTDIPYRALLEVIMNAIVHRDYTIENVRIMIDVDDNKVIISSPGDPLVPIEKFRSFSAPSVSRNPKIAYILYEMGLIEERGFGMEELSKIESVFGLPKPTFELDENILKTTIYRGIIKEPDTDKIKPIKGLKELKTHKILTTPKYIELTGVSERTARRHLNDLVKEGHSRREGKGPAIKYILIE